MNADVSTPLHPESSIFHSFAKRPLTALCCTATALLILCGSPPALAQSQDPRPSDDLEAAWEPAAGAEERAVESWFYAMDTGGGDGSGTLFRLGVTASGGFVGVEVVGETGVRDVFDIAFLGDRLFGIGPGTSFGTTDDVLIEIDPRTGASSGVGTIDPEGNFNALVGETATTLLAASTTGEVWRIDPFALTAARVGSFGSGFGSSGDLALTPAGVLYGTLVGSPTDTLATIDRTTGRASLVGSIGFREAYGLAVNPVNNALLGVVDGEGNPKLVTVNRANGAATVIGAIPVPHGIAGIAAGPAPATGCPAGFFADSGFPDFCFRVTIGSPGSAGTREPACLPETVCVSGALPGRSELFVRIIGPRPNGFLWPTIVRFTPARVVVDIRQRSTGQTNRYVLPAIPPGVDELSGLQDRTGFRP